MITTTGATGRTSITMALPDSGNLLAHTAIKINFHKMLKVPLEDTNIKAQATNKYTLEILGVSRGICIRFPNVTKIFCIKPLVMQNLSCHLNLGAQFNFKTRLIPQTVKQGADGKKINFCELDGI